MGGKQKREEAAVQEFGRCLDLEDKKGALPYRRPLKCLVHQTGDDGE